MFCRKFSEKFPNIFPMHLYVNTLHFENICFCMCACQVYLPFNILNVFDPISDGVVDDR